MNEKTRQAIERLASFDRDHSDEAVEAARAIGALGAESLCAALLSPHALNVPRGRHALKEELAKQDADAIAPTLIEALAHPDWRPNQVASDVIGLISDAMTPRLIASLVEGADAHGLTNTVTILRRMGIADAAPAMARLAARDARPEVRESAVEALGWLGAPESADAVLRALSDSNSSVRFKAVKAAGWLRMADAIDGILAFAKDADAEGRAAAVYALDRIGDARAADLVGTLFADPDPYVRWSAAVAMRRLWKDERREAVESAVKDSESTVAAAALETLCIKSPASAKLLQSATMDSRPAVGRVGEAYASRVG